MAVFCTSFIADNRLSEMFKRIETRLRNFENADDDYQNCVGLD